MEHNSATVAGRLTQCNITTLSVRCARSIAGSQESECLVEEAFRLWNTTISSLPDVPPQLLALLPHLGALLTRGKVRMMYRHVNV